VGCPGSTFAPRPAPPPRFAARRCPALLTRIPRRQRDAELAALRLRLATAESSLAEEARRSREAAARAKELEISEQVVACPLS
jgi:hypothetical protein